MPRLPFRSLLAPFAALALATATPAAVEIVHVWPGWREAGEFDSLREFFGGAERTGGDVVVRTDPAARAGFYFLARVHRAADDPAPVRARLEVIAPDATEAVAHTFDLAPAGRRRQVYLFGLTGEAWTAGAREPLAWRLTFLGADGAAQATAQSFLWAAPDA